MIIFPGKWALLVPWSLKVPLNKHVYEPLFTQGILEQWAGLPIRGNDLHNTTEIMQSGDSS